MCSDLKRFDHGSFRKLTTLVDFPFKDLDLTKFAAESSKYGDL